MSDTPETPRPESEERLWTAVNESESEARQWDSFQVADVSALFDELARLRSALAEAQQDRDSVLEVAACIADGHWPEAGHEPQHGAVSCAMSISITIRRLKSTYYPDRAAHTPERPV